MIHIHRTTCFEDDTQAGMSICERRFQHRRQLLPVIAADFDFFLQQIPVGGGNRKVVLYFHHFQDIIRHCLESLTHGITVEASELLFNIFSRNSDVLGEFYICSFETVIFHIENKLVKL